jgi:ArsR family transcriptional regulator
MPRSTLRTWSAPGSSRLEARSIIYHPCYPALTGLIRFLMEDCCQGRPEVCAPAIVDLIPSYPSEEPAHG